MELTDHKINELNEVITITPDERDLENGNASHVYDVDCGSGTRCRFVFQQGPIKEKGVNGITNEVLLAILIDRLSGFQSGAYACDENALALSKLKDALHWLHARTQARVARGVEGTSTP